MRRMALFAVAVTMLAVSAARAAEKDRYWEWGWGSYGAGSVADDARFDWSMINFGNVPADERTVARCNEILKTNPKHKFVIRAWPIMGKGDCPENRHQATLFHYLYKPGVRERVLEETRRQIELIVKGVSKPESVVGCCFLEELPGHFTSCPFRGPAHAWKKGDPLPWDMKRFQKEIEKELGGPVDWAGEAHRLWWGKKYAGVINEINRTMKEASGGRTVIYYQATGFNTLDHLNEGETLLSRAGTVPIRYGDILVRGVCDGIFGYPNSPKVWETQTVRPVEKYSCLLFSQISLPPGMRLSKIEEMVETARWRNPGNLGAFFYGTHGRKIRAWNELPYQDDSFWTLSDHARRFGWDHKINMDVVNRYLAPTIEADYNFAGKKKGDYVHVHAQVFSPRDPSWYGGDAAEATIRDAKATIALPEGFSIKSGVSAPATIQIARIGPRECAALDWWVSVDRDDAAFRTGESLVITLAGAGGVRGRASFTETDRRILPDPSPWVVGRAGDVRIEPAYRDTPLELAVEIKPAVEILEPGVSSGHRGMTYRGAVVPGMRLVMGPGKKARLYRDAIFTPEERRFAPRPQEPDGTVVFSTGGLVFGSRTVPVEPGQTYRLILAGSATGDANISAAVRHEGRKTRRESVVKDAPLPIAKFGAAPGTVAASFTVPDLGDVESQTIRILLHRQCPKDKEGTLRLISIDLKDEAFPDTGIDVTDRTEGVLPGRVRPFSTWIYRDLSDPRDYGGPKAEIRFLPVER